MARIEPLPPEQLPDSAKAVIDFAQATMGFLPNDALTMARWPELLEAMMPVVAVLFGPGRVDMELKRLVALVTSSSAGCEYCIAHNIFGLLRDGVDPDKRAALRDLPGSLAFTEAERAALVFARALGRTPNALTDAEYAELEKFFDERQIMELAGVACLFGFLNRWNSTFQTTLEDAPRERIQALSGSQGEASD